MAGPTSANYVFLPWVRQGAAAGIQTPDSVSAAAAVSMPATLRINDTVDIERQVRLYGPGDVISIDRQQVVRTEPRHLATDFEPNYFPSIDFDRPDFPWIFTPAAAVGTGRLRPWLCLVVVRKQDGVTLRTDPSLPVAVLDIAAPALPERELPDLAESWAWAHGQVTGTQRDAAALKQSLAGDPALTVSRLLCPRRLDPLTAYLACLVPTFEPGRRAGLGLPNSANQLTPAWDFSAQAPVQVTLPVYFFWEFRTGAGGDFEQLVRSLEPRQMPAEAGKLLIQIAAPGFTIDPPLPQGTALEFEGALRVKDAQPTDWPAGTQTPFQTALKPILDAPWRALKEGTEPLLAPPIYGAWHAAQHTVDLPPAQPATPWLHELNLDPRYRAVAAMGTRVVQTQQEQLMAAAWEQLGEIERINQIRRQAQLARAVNSVYHARDFSQFSEETLLKVLAPAQSRVLVEATDTANRTTQALLVHRIAQSAIPVSAVSAPLRRLTSARGVVAARFQAVSTQPMAIIAKLNTTILVPRERPGAGLVTINQVSDASPALTHAVRFEQISTAVDAAPQLNNFRIAAEGDTAGVLAPLVDPTVLAQPRPPDNADATAFREAVKAHQSYLVQSAFISFLTFPAPALDLSDTKHKLLASINPEATINARVQASISAAGGTALQGDPLEPILDAPEFPQPMYAALRDLSQDFLFPGLEHVPADSVTLLETNSAFVESFLVGLNVEMARELLWRNYPTDQRGTYFRHFWDTSTGNGQPDIDRIDAWGNRELGQNSGAGDQLVLLIRGELLRRFPNAVIYAVAAVDMNGQLDLSPSQTDERQPLFRGTLTPDITFVGFNLTREVATAAPGWFFVIQEHPTEPRFGLDAADFNKALPELTTWNNLSWRHLANTETALAALSHASVKTVLPVIGNVEWGKNAAHQAYITLQHPVRIAIHARQMIV